MEATNLVTGHSLDATVIKAPEPKQPTFDKRLIIPNLTREIKKIEVLEDGKSNTSFKDGVIKLKLPRPKLKVTVTFADGTTRIYERDFRESIRVLADDINIR